MARGYADWNYRVPAPCSLLIALGVLSRRKDGRIDVPDIYRYGFGIKRKGGVARPR